MTGERLRERLEILLGNAEAGERGEPLDILRCHAAGHRLTSLRVCDSPRMAFQELVEELRDATRASRVTLRLDSPDAFFAVVAEARAPGVRSIANDTTIDLRAAPTFEFLERERRPLVQEDLLDADPAPPPELIEHYGARAQMLAPVVVGDRLVGIVSIHYAPGPRSWSSEEIAALERAAERVEAELDRTE